MSTVNSFLAIVSSPAIAAILGAIVGGVIGARTSKRQIKKESFNRAAGEFRSAFIPEITTILLDSGEPGLEHFNILDILKAEFPKHLKAVMMFRPYLGKGQRRRFDSIWEKYCWPNGQPETDEEQKEFLFIDYFAHWEDSNIKKQILQHLKELLTFADLK